MNSIILKNQLTQEAIKIAVVTAICLFILMLRIKWSHEFFYLFMGWNLFLALIPYGILWTLKMNYESVRDWSNLSKKFLAVGTLLLWILFLPNAPYMLTDFIHFNVDSSLWLLDLMMLSVFSVAGLYAMFLSLEHAVDIMASELTFLRIHGKKWTYIILFLCSFGVYLGRNLRYNSWHLLSKPEVLLMDIIDLFIHPATNSIAWIQIIIFGGILMACNWVFQKLSTQ